MSLFVATVAQVQEDVGDTSVIAVKDRNTADYCQLWALVERKDNLLYMPCVPCLPKFEYVPTQVFLNDILEEPLDNVKRLETKSILFEDYVNDPSRKMSGKVGGKVSGLFKVGGNASETWQEEMKLGNIGKKEIFWGKLYETIRQQKVKKDHPLVSLIRENKRRKLFVITMVIYSGEEHLESTEEMTVDAGVTLPPDIPVKASGCEDRKQHTQFVVPAGTCLCYSCDELTIDDKGFLSLELEEDVKY